MAERLLALADEIVSLLAQFDPRRRDAAQCVAIVEALSRLEKATAAARARTAAAIGTHPERLALLTGLSTAEAARQLAVTEQLATLPETRRALGAGTLSLAQAHEIAQTVAVSPGAEREMVATAQRETLRTLRDLGRKRRLAALDPVDLHERQRAARWHRHWRDELGMVRYSGAMVPEVGVPFMKRVDLETDRCWRSRRRGAGSAEGAEGADAREPTHEQLAADAFATVVAGTGKPHAVRADVVYVCNLDTGAAHIVGGGPLPRATVDEAARAGFVKAVLHDGTKIDTVVHYGRRALPAVVRTAIELGDPPDFDGIRCTDCDRRLGLQWDHVDPVANGGPTRRDNFAPRCYRCHQAKTERDRRAGRLGGGRDRPP